MPNTSASGGPLSPAGTPAPLEGLALNQFIQQWMVGLTGMAGNLIRPRWQPEPASIPTEGNAWAAVGIIRRPRDTFPYISHDATGNGSDNLFRNESLECLASFYDLGVNGMADQLAALFADDALIPQNSEALLAGGFMLVEVGEPVTVPSLLKSRWLYRTDVPFTLRRTVARNYPVENVLTAQVVITEQDPSGNNATITVNVHNP
jgi:hypothetical protein